MRSGNLLKSLVYRSVFWSCLICLSLASQIGRADIVLDWNQIATDVLVSNTDLQNPGMSSRSLAMMNLAIYDAFEMTTSGGTMFYDYGAGHNSPNMDASGKAAAIQAAHTVLSSIYTDQQSMLDSHLATSLSQITDGTSKTDGIALGLSIGQSIVQRRTGDGYNSMSQYMPTNQLGRWQPDPLNPTQEAWGPEWGNVQTFAISSPNAFLPAAPPSLDSPEYAAAYNEVKELGELNSTTRTSEQTDIGNFWAYDRVGMGTPMHLYNDILRVIAGQEGNTEKENADLFAKASVAMADAGIVSWNSKFEYDFWRPVTGIRQGDFDGNIDTEGDEDWTPLGAPGGGVNNNFTPPFPTYLSGHATFGGALFQALIDFYGTDNIPFSVFSEEISDTRSFNTFSEAMIENGRSRVYLGIHWNYDDTLGQVAGSQVASYISSGPFVSATSIPEPSTIMMLAVASTLFCSSRRSKQSH